MYDKIHYKLKKKKKKTGGYCVITLNVTENKV